MTVRWVTDSGKAIFREAAMTERAALLIRRLSSTHHTLALSILGPPNLGWESSNLLSKRVQVQIAIDSTSSQMVPEFCFQKPTKLIVIHSHFFFQEKGWVAQTKKRKKGPVIFGSASPTLTLLSGNSGEQSQSKLSNYSVCVWSIEPVSSPDPKTCPLLSIMIF